MLYKQFNKENHKNPSEKKASEIEIPNITDSRYENNIWHLDAVQAQPDELITASVTDLVDDVPFIIPAEDVKYLSRYGIYVVADSNMFIHNSACLADIITRSK